MVTACAKDTLEAEGGITCFGTSQRKFLSLEGQSEILGERLAEVQPSMASVGELTLVWGRFGGWD